MSSLSVLGKQLTPSPHVVVPPSNWPPQIVALLAGTFLVRAAGFAYPFLSFRLIELKYSTALIGWVLATFGVGWLVGQLLCGWLSDRLGRRTTLAGTMLIAAFVLPVLAAVQAPTAVLAATMVAGVVYDAHRPIVSAVITDVIPTESGRALVNGWRHFAVNVGAAVTGAVGGVLVGYGGMPLLLCLNAAACIGFGLIALKFLPPTPVAVAFSKPRTTFAQALRDTRLWVLCCASLAALTCAAGMFSTLPMLMTEDGLGATAYGWTQVANGGAVLVLTPVLAPWLSRRAIGDAPMLGPFAAGSLLLGVGLGGAGLASTTWEYSLSAAVAVPGEIILFIAASDLVNRISPVGGRGLYAGIWGSNLALAIIIAPLLAAWAIDTGGDLLAAATTLAAGLAGALLSVLLHVLLLNSPQLVPPPNGPTRAGELTHPAISEAGQS